MSRLRVHGSTVAWVVSYFLAVALTHYATQESRLHAVIWPATALAIAALQAPGPRIVRSLLMIPACILGHVAGGGGVAEALLYTIGEGLHVAATTALLLWAGGLRSFLTSLRAFVLYCVATAGPGLAAVMIGSAGLMHQDPAAWRYALGSFLGSWLSDLLLLPIIALLSEGGVSSLTRRALAAILFAVLVALAAFLTPLPLLFLVFPAAVGAVVTAGAFGGLLACLVVAAISILATLSGHGPLQFRDSTVLLETTSLQVYLISLILTTLALATLLEQQRRLQAARDEVARRERRALDRVEIVERGADLGTWVTDLTQYAIELNERAFQQLGLPVRRGLFPLDEWEQILHPGDLAAVRAVWQEHLEGRADDIDIESRFRHADGRWVTLAVNGRIVQRDADGRPVLMAGTQLDVTALRESERRFRAMAENIDGFLFRLEILAAGVVVLSQSTGQPFELLGVATQEITDNPDLRAALAGSGAAGRIRVETQHRRADGRPLWLRTTATPVPDTGGPRIFDCVAVDITAEREAEAKALSAERLVRDALESSGDAFLITDAERRFLLWNEHYLDQHPPLRLLPRLAGKTGAELMLQLVEMGIVRPDNVEAWIDGVIEQHSRLIEQAETTRIHDGRWIRVKAHQMPHGHRVIVGTDVTELKQKEQGLGLALEQVQQQAEKLSALAEQLEGERARAEEASRAKSEFLAAMSHELRTPLNGVIGFTDLMLTTPLNAEQRRYAEMQREAVGMLMALISDILDFSKIEAGKIELDPLAFSLRDLIRASAELIGHASQEKGLALRVEVAPDIPDCVIADPTRLRQILLNLLNNALKFTDRGHIALRVTTAAGGRVRFEIADTGIGISDDQRQRLFQEFTQADRSITRRYGGTGLGLAICRRLVDLMGGQIGVQSTPGAGSTFWVELPLPVGDKAQALAPPPRPDAGRTARILVVEDVRMNQLVAEGILGKAGHTVITANNGEEGYRRALQGDIDLVLMDVRMPVMDGFEATRRIRRAGGRFATLPVIGLTAEAGPSEQAAARESGMDTVLIKPFNVGQLLEAVQRGLARTPAEDPAAGAGETPILNEEFLDSIEAALGRNGVGALVEQLKREIQVRLPRLQQVANDEEAAEAMHTLVSVLGNVGLDRASSIARSGLAAARSRNGDFPRWTAALPAEVARGVEALERRLRA